jgi:CotH kinase protein
MRSAGLAFLTAATLIAVLPQGAAAQSEPLKLPVVDIDAPNGIVDDPKRPGTMRVLDRRRREKYNGHIGVELRGFTSQQDDPKKSLAVETRKASGDNDNVSLLGMPADDDWALIAAYRDESLLRNLVAYSTSRWVGQYAARTRLVEVFVNDLYEGVYLLVEDLKLHDDRLAVDDSDISGGYLLEMISMRRTQGEKFFTTPVQDEPILYKDPKARDISYGRASWIRRYVGRCEKRLYGDRFRERRRGYRRCLDVDAAVDYLLLNELFRNADTFRNSTYMYKSAGEKLVLGPLWDFDHAIGNDGTPEDNFTSGWEYGASSWAGRLYAHRGFRKRMARRWKALRRQGLKRHLVRTVNRGAGRLTGGPVDRNFSRWPIFETGAARPRDPRTGEFPASYAEAVDYLEWWLVRRFRWISRNIKTLGPATVARM